MNSPSSAVRLMLCPTSFTTFPRHNRCYTTFERTLSGFISAASSRKSLKQTEISNIISLGSTIKGIRPLFRELGFNEEETETLIRKNPNCSSTTLESISGLFVYLESVGIFGYNLCDLVSKRPEILTDKNISTFLIFVHENLQKLKPLKIEQLLSSIDFRFLLGFDEKVHIFIEHGVSEEKIVDVLNGINLKLFCMRKVEDIEEILVLFKRYDSDLVVRRPMLLNLDLKTQIIPRVSFLTELGEDDKFTAKVIKKLPLLLSYTTKHLNAHKEFLQSIGLVREEISKIVLVYPGIFTVSKERRLQPRIEFLKQCGLNSRELFKFFTKAPLFLSLSFERNLSIKMGFLFKIGYENHTVDFALAIGATTRTSCENMQLLLGVLLSYGFSCEDILSMSKKHPQILQYNHSSLERKMEYLVYEMGREIGELLSFPAFLGYKLDDRIKQRYEAKKHKGEGLSLNKLLSVSTEKFSNKNTSIRCSFPSLIDQKITIN